MAYVSFRKKRGLRKRRAPLRRKAAVPKARGASAISRVVKRVLSHNMETKYASNQYSLSYFNSGINSTGDFITLLPAIASGIGQNQRIGDSIEPIKLVIRGYLVYSTSIVTYIDARMILARMFCFQDKSTRSYALSSANYQLIDLGGSSGPFTGTQMSVISPKNTDMFTFYADKKFKFIKPYGLTNGGVQNNALVSPNNTLWHPFTITLTKKQIPAHLKFDAGLSTNFPVNFAPYLAVGYADLLGASPDVANTQIQMEFCSTLYYKDS